MTATVPVLLWLGLAVLVATMAWAPAAPGVYRPLELIVPTVALPLVMPSTDQVAPPVKVVVKCCVCHGVIAPTGGTSKGAVLPTIVTLSNTAVLSAPS